MEIFRGSWSSFADVRDSVVTVGFFDGVHLGHRAILDRVVEAAAAQALRSTMLTFEPHPREVIREGSAPVGLITTLDEKLELIASAGIQQTLVFEFDHGLSQMTAADFVQIVLKGRIGMRRVVIGFNHAFGRHRTGDRETLIAMSRSLSFSVDVVNPTRVGEHIVSSSHVRHLISDGQVAQAAEALGRFHTVKGIIVRGFGRGKRLHWPTANLGLIAPGKLCPRDGIYAGLARVQDEVHPAAIALGFNPTFTEGKHSVEAHLIDFDRDIYDEPMELQFIERIRNEKKFSGEAELSAQIASDVRTASELLAARGLLKRVP